MRFHYGCPITKAWTGLGSASAYKQAVEDGLMECATTLKPGYSTWWRLTPLGAGIVLAWIGMGYTYERIESGDTPCTCARIVGPSRCGAATCMEAS